MAVKKTAFFVGALAGAGLAVAALAATGVKLPAVIPHGGSLIPASTAPVFAPPPGAPQSFADIFERVSPAVVSIHVTSKMDVQALRRSIPGFENFPFDIVPKGQGGGGPAATTIDRRPSSSRLGRASSSRRTATSSPTTTSSTAPRTSRSSPRTAPS